jgi:signal transduction histidine kinase
MHQVLTNMLDNALAVTSPPDRVEVTASFGDGSLVLTVRDRGPGIPATERQQIFEPFHTTKTRGTGLGLAVAKRIVEMHGGSVIVRDADGGGALFRISVPGPADAVAT